MQVTVIGRHTEIPENLRQYMEEKVEKLPRFYNRVMSVQIIVDGELSERKVELIISAAGHQDFVAEEKGQDLFACFDICLDKMEKQLRRFKERLQDRKHHSGGRKEEAFE